MDFKEQSSVFESSVLRALLLGHGCGIRLLVRALNIEGLSISKSDGDTKRQSLL